MLRIRLRRVGAKKQPSYRLVVADITSPRDGAFVSVIGHYNPLTNPETVVIDQEKAAEWLKKGAQPSNTAARLLAKFGLVERPPIPKIVPKPTIKPEEKKTEPAQEIKPEEKT